MITWIVLVNLMIHNCHQKIISIACWLMKVSQMKAMLMLKMLGKPSSQSLWVNTIIYISSQIYFYRCFIGWCIWKLSKNWFFALQYRSKVSWHSILDPRENWESIIETRLLRLDSRFSIPTRLIKPERSLFIIDWKGFLSSNLLSTYTRVNQFLRESTTFVQVFSIF